MAGLPKEIEEHGVLVTGYVENSSSTNSLQYRQDDATGSVADYTGPGFLKQISVFNESQSATHTLAVFDDTITIFSAEIPQQLYRLSGIPGGGLVASGSNTFVYTFPEPGLYFSGPLKSSGDSSELLCSFIAQAVSEDALVANGGMPKEIEEHGILTARITKSSADTYTDAAYYRQTNGTTATYTGAGFIKSLVMTNDSDAVDTVAIGDNTSGGVVEIFRWGVSASGPEGGGPVGNGPTVINFPEPGLYFSGTLQQKSVNAQTSVTPVIKLVDEKAVA